MADQVTTTFDNTFAHRLATESWSLYGVGVFIFCLRVYSKLRFSSIRHLDADDYVCILALGLYTGLIVCMNVIASGGGSNLYLPGEDANFTAEDIKDRIFGSKIVIVSEQCMLCVIYSLKACVLLFYRRLMTGLNRQRLVTYVSYAVILGWLATEIAFFTACRPFNGYWAVPPPDPQCTTLEHYAIVQACFNIPTDLAMLSISIPIVYRLQVPLKQKLLVGVLFSMGIFVVIAAILTKVFNLSDVYSTSYMLWYIREASVATYVANLPAVWPLVRHVFPCLRSVSSVKYSGQVKYGDVYGGNSGMMRTTGRQKTGNNTVIDAMEMDERALKYDGDSSSDRNQDLGVLVHTTVEITKERENF
ncbi:Non-canonical poly(A) RNA polymerase PAPD5 [Sphaceloma murrayae]|uniref:Non-canonical poly(A) RNA polymerase PAPD5 n=1 Tax=Sphaceloma murrayae TaxID=2082308 RepID=A0A2K1QJM1_9PEZI|nr:Non-canonical poly(A) RNA polymerase PAPD5 [Sphaceloma murrayae]